MNKQSHLHREKGGCDCPCAQCDIGAHCGRVEMGCEFFEDDDDDEDD